MDTQTIIMAVAASLGIPAPETLSKCKIDKLCDFNIRYLSLLTFFAHAYESGQMSEQRIITIVRDWEERSGFAIASRETVYRIKNYLFQVVLGNRASVAGKGFWSKGFPLIPKNAVQTERN